MLLSISKDDLLEYVCRQLNYFYPDNNLVKKEDIKVPADFALERTEYCFLHINVNGYKKDDNAMFNHLHSDQYSQFLYYLSNSIYRLDYNCKISDKLILLNKALHGCWYSYKGKLPDIFLMSHPVGTVLGNACYSDYMVVLQNVTVNTGEKPNETPVLGKELFLSAGSKIIGNGNIGDKVTLGVNSIVYKQDVPSNTLVYCDLKGQQQMKNYHSLASKYFFID